MPDRGLRSWRVEATEPAENGGRKYNRNVNLIVYALSLEEVVTAVRERHPEITLHKVMGDRWAEDVIVVNPDA